MEKKVLNATRFNRSTKGRRAPYHSGGGLGIHVSTISMRVDEERIVLQLVEVHISATSCDRHPEYLVQTVFFAETIELQARPRTYSGSLLIDPLFRSSFLFPFHPVLS